jgi:hypothetical protein
MLIGARPINLPIPIVAGMLILFCLVMPSCQRRHTSDATVKVDYGKSVEFSDTLIPGVVSLRLRSQGQPKSSCTGTAVSSSTVLTAAHCVEGVDEVCARTAAGGNFCSKNIGSHPHFVNRHNGASSLEHDIAWIVFPKGTFQYYFYADMDILPEVGSRVAFVGYSVYFGYGSGGSKRWGENEIEAIDGDSAISHRRVERGVIYAGLSPGDSGGPMLNENCELIGVASSMQLDSGIDNSYASRKTNRHALFAAPVNGPAVKKAIIEAGGDFCSLSEHNCVDSKSLEKPVTSSYQPINPSSRPSVQSRKFWCKADAESSDQILIAALNEMKSKSSSQQPLPYTTCEDWLSGTHLDVNSSVCFDVGLQSISNQNDRTQSCSRSAIDEFGRLRRPPQYGSSMGTGLPANMLDFALTYHLSSGALNRLTCQGTSSSTLPSSSSSSSISSPQCCISTACYRPFDLLEFGMAGARPVPCPMDGQNWPESIRKFAMSKLFFPSAEELRRILVHCDYREGVQERTRGGICYRPRSPEAQWNDGEQLIRNQVQCFKVEQGGIATTTPAPCPP